MSSDAKIQIVVEGEAAAKDAIVRVGDALRQTGDGAHGAGEHLGVFGRVLQEMTSTGGKVATEFGEKVTEGLEHPLDFAKNAVTGLATELGPMGVGLVAAGGVAVAAGVGVFELGEKIFGLAEHAAHVGGEINDMSEKTSMSAEATSRLKYAMDVAGGSIEQASNLIFKMQERMATSPDDFRNGLSRIHLSIQDIESLSPDEQFLKISAAFKENTDQSNRAATAVELFSKQGRDAIPLLLKPLDELVKKGEELGFTWSDTDARAAEEFEMAVNAMRLEIEKVSIDIGKELIPTLKFFIEHVHDAVSEIKFFLDAGDGWSLALQAYHKQLADLDTITRAFTGDLGELPKITRVSTEETEKYSKANLAQAGIVLDTKGALRDLEEQHKKNTDASKKAADAAEKEAKKVADAQNDLAKATAKTAQELRKFDDELGVRLLKAAADGWKEIRKVNAEIGKIEQNAYVANFGFRGMADGLTTLGEHTDDIDKLKSYLSSLPTAVDPFLQVLNDLPGLMMQAFTGGGGFEGAIKAYYTKLASDLLNSFMAQFKTGDFSSGWTQAYSTYKDGKLFGTGTSSSARTAQLAQAGIGLGADLIANATENPETKKGQVGHYAAVGAKYGSIVPGVGTLAGAGIGALVGALKVSPVEINARKEYADWQTTIIAQFDKMASGEEKTRAGDEAWKKVNIEVSDAYQALGMSGDQALKDIGTALDATHHSSQDVKAATDQMTAAIDAYAKILPVAKQGEQDVLAELSNMQSISPDVEAALQKVYDAKNVGEYADAIQDVNSLLAGQASNTRAVDEDLKKYGLSWTKLGTDAKTAHLDQIARGLIADFTTLRGAGLSVADVMGGKDGVTGAITGMGASLNDFVKQAQSAGVEVPEAMKPALQAAIDNGTLLDENGNKYADLASTGLTFGTTMSEGFDKVTLAINHLADTLTGGLAGGFADATKKAKDLAGAVNSVPSKAPWSYWDPPPGAEIVDLGGSPSYGRSSTVGSYINAARQTSSSSARGISGGVGGGSGIAQPLVIKLNNRVLARETIKIQPAELRRMGWI